MGDKVQIEECRPISKNKSFRVITTPDPNAGRPVRVCVERTSEKPKRPQADTAKKERATAKKEKAVAAQSARGR